MKSFKVTTYPAKILSKKAKSVEATPDLEDLVLSMIQTMKDYNGIGLAAPQIDILKQIIVVRGSKKDLAFINPRIAKKSKETYIHDEGCLSLPNLFLDIKRSSEVDIIATTLDGKEVKIHVKGLTARIFQHEIDHLQGKLIINRISPFRRFKIRKQLKEISNDTGK